MPVRVSNSLLQPVFKQESIGQPGESIMLGLIGKPVSQLTMFNGDRSHISRHFKPAAVMEMRLTMLAKKNEYQAHKPARGINYRCGPARFEVQQPRPLSQNCVRRAAGNVPDENYFPFVAAGT